MVPAIPAWMSGAAACLSGPGDAGRILRTAVLCHGNAAAPPWAGFERGGTKLSHLWRVLPRHSPAMA